MKKFIYFCGLIVLVSLYASCGDSSEFFDEDVVYQTRTRSSNDCRIEIVLPGSHTSEQKTLIPGVTATIHLSWNASPSEHVSASCDISIDSTEVYRINQNYPIYAQIHDLKAMAKYYVEIKRRDKDTIVYSDYVEEEIAVETDWQTLYK